MLIGGAIFSFSSYSLQLGIFRGTCCCLIKRLNWGRLLFSWLWRHQRLECCKRSL